MHEELMKGLRQMRALEKDEHPRPESNSKTDKGVSHRIRRSRSPSGTWGRCRSLDFLMLECIMNLRLTTKGSIALINAQVLIPSGLVHTAGSSTGPGRARSFLDVSGQKV